MVVPFDLDATTGEWTASFVALAIDHHDAVHPAAKERNVQNPAKILFSFSPSALYLLLQPDSS